VNPLGLYDLDRNIRAVGRSYKKLIHDWHAVLPRRASASRCRVVPPSEYENAEQMRARLEARSREFLDLAVSDA
jgi:hypothetical protein